MSQTKQVGKPYAEKRRLIFRKTAAETQGNLLDMMVGKLLGYRGRYEKCSGSEVQAEAGHQAEVSIWIDRPPAEVFRFIANYNNDTLWRHGVARMTQSPTDETGAGTLTQEEMVFLGRRYMTIAQITVFEPDRRLEWTSVEATTPVSGWRMVEPEGCGARFTQMIQADLQGIYRWLAPVMVGMLKKQMVQDVANLKSLLEHSEN